MNGMQLPRPYSKKLKIKRDIYEGGFQIDLSFIQESVTAATALHAPD